MYVEVGSERQQGPRSNRAPLMIVITSDFSLSRNPLKRFEQRSDYSSIFLSFFFKADLEHWVEN